MSHAADFILHLDISYPYRVIFEVSAENGGYVVVADRDISQTDGKLNRYFYNGQILTREFEFHWDLDQPYHCSVSSGTSCDAFISIPTDITNNVSLSLVFTVFFAPE